MPSAATKTPPELFKDILWFVNHDVLGHEIYRGRTEKRALSRCSQVCRHWARTCRPLLFRDITLCSGNELSSFKRILLTPPPAALPPIADYVQFVRLQIERTEPPWVHHFQSDCIPLLSPKCQFNVVISSSPMEGLNAVQSVKAIFDTLPRPAPCAHACFTGLTLAHLHFHDAAALCRLVSGFRGLQELNLSHLTWDIAPDAAAALPTPMRSLPHLRKVLVALCGDYIDMVPMLVLPAFAKGGAVGGLSNDYFRLFRLLKRWAFGSENDHLSISTTGNHGEQREVAFLTHYALSCFMLTIP